MDGGAGDGDSAVYRAPGVAFGVHSGDARFLSGFAKAFVALRAPAETAPDTVYEVVNRGPAFAPSRWLVYRDDVLLNDARTDRDALDIILGDLDYEVIKAVVDTSLAVHAGAVELGGAVALLPAASGSGKTTLTAAAVAAGGGYLSDEVAIVSPSTLWVSPYPRPLCIKPGSHSAVGPMLRVAGRPAAKSAIWHVSPAQLGRTSSGGRLAAVIVPAYSAQARTELLPMSRAEGMLAIAGQSSLLSRRGSSALTILRDLVLDSRCERLIYSDASQAAKLLLDVLA